MTSESIGPLSDSRDDGLTDQQTDPACVERWLDALRIDTIHPTWEREADDAE